jgi:hypothetical protein
LQNVNVTKLTTFFSSNTSVCNRPKCEFWFIYLFDFYFYFIEFPMTKITQNSIPHTLGLKLHNSQYKVLLIEIFFFFFWKHNNKPNPTSHWHPQVKLIGIGPTRLSPTQQWVWIQKPFWGSKVLNRGYTAEPSPLKVHWAIFKQYQNHTPISLKKFHWIFNDKIAQYSITLARILNIMKPLHWELSNNTHGPDKGHHGLGDRSQHNKQNKQTNYLPW